MGITRVTGSVDDPNPKLDSVSIGDPATTVDIDGVVVDVLASLHTEGATDLGGLVEHRHSDTAAFGSHIMLARSRGAEGAETIVQDGDVVGRLVFLVCDGVDYKLGAEIRTEVDGIPGVGDVPTKVIIATTPAGSKTPIDRFEVGADGAISLTETLTVIGNQSVGVTLKSWGGDFKVSGISNAKIEYTNTTTGETGTAHWCYHNGANWVYVDSTHDARRYYELSGERFEPYAASGTADATITWDDFQHNEAWITPTLLNSWVNYAAGFNTLQYKKDADGIVTIKGVVKDGTLDTTIFILPAGYRPAARFWTRQAESPSGTLARIDIYATGSVDQVNGTSTTILTIDAIFKAEQ
jgi:hypothetical protein